MGKKAERAKRFGLPVELGKLASDQTDEEQKKKRARQDRFASAEGMDKMVSPTSNSGELDEAKKKRAERFGLGTSGAAAPDTKTDEADAKKKRLERFGAQSEEDKK